VVHHTLAACMGATTVPNARPMPLLVPPAHWPTGDDGDTPFLQPVPSAFSASSGQWLAPDGGVHRRSTYPRLHPAPSVFFVPSHPDVVLFVDLHSFTLLYPLVPGSSRILFLACTTPRVSTLEHHPVLPLPACSISVSSVVLSQPTTLPTTNPHPTILEPYRYPQPDHPRPKHISLYSTVSKSALYLQARAIETPTG